jgi:signal transduction histidine kinase
LYIFIICQTIAFSKQFLRAFIKIGKLNRQLEQINNELQIKNDTINETNEQLSMLNAELESLVFRTSHDLRSPITSMYAMADIIKMEENTQVRNEYIDF